MLRVEEPAVAVMVTEVALNDCQFSVTLCPLLIEFVLAEKISVGPPLDFKPAQPTVAQTAAIKIPQEMQRTASFFIRSTLSPQVRPCANLMREAACMVAVIP